MISAMDNHDLNQLSMVKDSLSDIRDIY